ncbi:portal protein [uncultured Roseibium sp.]|uniref:portal protein n=1 Tax=uncultured Roseibium sp. TaxID=1936171 RepID=UPI00260DB144|nr:portal protein [uncultured Roseibium sp.]
MSDDSGLLREAQDAFEEAEEFEKHNRDTYIEDNKFARLGEQWPEKIKEQRQADGRPCLTINKMPAFLRQVVNDARQNKPSMKVGAVDSSADPDTAKVINGLIRNIEHISNADVAYDTGVECAVGGGFGYWQVDIDYAFDDTFDLDILIERITNPLTVYGDPNSTAAESSDWNTAFRIERLKKDKFKELYPEADRVDWKFDFQDVSQSWFDGDYVMVADWWRREQVDKTILLLSDGTVLDENDLEDNWDWIVAGNITPIKSRVVKSHKVTRNKLTGAEVLSVDEWPGKYIPIIPVYGEEFDIGGKVYRRSLIHNGKDAQQMFNFWRTAGAELVALAPRVPFIGPVGSFVTDANKWQSANSVSYSHIEYDVVKEGQNIMPPPQRQPLDSGVAAGALQESLNAADDMKSIIGLYDASLGARSNETSGRAIMARQREGDVSTFHFLDNLTRSIRHTGTVVLDLIPHVYNEERIIRVLGEDGTESQQAINQAVPKIDTDGNPMMEEVLNDAGQPVMQPLTRVFDLTVGKYDLVVNAGPSFTSRREEAATQMTEMIRAYPDIAPVIGDLIAKNMDWPGADEIAKRLQKMLPQQLQEQAIPPEIQKQIEEGMSRIKQLEEENASLKADKSLDAMKLKIEEQELELKKIVDLMGARTSQFEAITDRMQATGSLQPQMQYSATPAQPHFQNGFAR